MTRDELDPWRVICNVLFELDSDEITEIIGKTDLRDDWTLDKKEKYSHKTRKRNYLPRINNSYDVLSDDDKTFFATGCDMGPDGDAPSTETLHHEGRIYTPVGQDERGCIRYSAQIPGGVAPAALYHQLQNGKFVIAHDGTDCANGGLGSLIK